MAVYKIAPKVTQVVRRGNVETDKNKQYKESDFPDGVASDLVSKGFLVVVDNEAEKKAEEEAKAKAAEEAKQKAEAEKRAKAK